MDFKSCRLVELDDRVAVVGVGASRFCPAPWSMRISFSTPREKSETAFVPGKSSAITAWKRDLRIGLMQRKEVGNAGIRTQS